MTTNVEKALPVEQKLPEVGAEHPGELAKTAMIAVILALMIRAFLFEPFNIPSGSMVPTLQVGDYLFVSKYSYGYSNYSFPFAPPLFEGRVAAEKPQRGDVVVFRLPSNPSVDYIKRLVALPGETVQVVNGRLYINDQLIPREPVGMLKYEGVGGDEARVMEYVETLPNGVLHKIYEEGDSMPLDNTKKFTVPEGSYFMMGDNRDNSQDSRVMDLVGFVPFENFIGRAERIFYSTNGYARVYEFWKWPWTVRYNRLMDKISPPAPKKLVEKQNG